MKQHFNITIKQVKAVDNLYNLERFSVGNTALYFNHSLMDENVKVNQRP
jgi:hypothetical protein